MILLMGYPASGKSTIAREHETQGYIVLNRDAVGGKVEALVPKMEELLRAGKKVLLDNTFPTVKSRKPFLAAVERLKDARTRGVWQPPTITCLWLKTSIEDAQFNACTRMVRKFGKLLTPEEIKQAKDPNAFPPAPLFRYRKIFEAPTTAEGFERVHHLAFERDEPGYHTRAIIVDYDGTLRITQSGDKFPVSVDDVHVLPRRKEILKSFQDKGFLILGASNQSGVAKGVPPMETAHSCFKQTNFLLDVDIEYLFCPHSSAPISCWCRKPMPGLSVAFIEKHNLNASECIVVGDMISDKTFAKRSGMEFEWAEDFFK